MARSEDGPRPRILDDPELSFKRYAALGVLLGRMGYRQSNSGSATICFAERVYGELAAQASEALKLLAEGLHACLQVALAVPHERRAQGGHGDAPGSPFGAPAL